MIAPTDAAFGKLPAGTVETLVKPENKGTLTSILTYHVVAGKLGAADIVAAIKAGGGSAVLTTVQGGMSMVTIADVNQSNGVIHVVDTVVLP